MAASRFQAGTSPFPHNSGRMHQVKPRPPHRSLTFWSGILVMGSICWAWRDSMTYSSYATVGKLQLWNDGALVQICWMQKKSPGKLKTGRYPDRGRAATGPITAPMFIRGEDSNEEGLSLKDGEALTYQNRVVAVAKWGLPLRAWVLLLPHWLLLLAVAMPWSGALLWRARRIRCDRPELATVTLSP